ncbi:acetylornithine transaminase [Propionicicella superfundia]|uniref:acetylornithine transaminase n=1 Tax=Propionicicella superfundia TaxID=348582 RepID=UPI0003F825C4|nr:acetylornithine transaminase [Propionicicella superfundia]
MTQVAGATAVERYAQAVMNTFGPPQAVLVRGEGARVWDAAGKEYLDLLGGIAVNVLGHGHPALIEAVTTQLSTLGHVSNFFASEPQIALAERLSALVTATSPGTPARVFFTNSGTEANEAAFKLTRTTGRTRVIAFEGSFHGRTMGALALTANPAYREPFAPLPGDVTFLPYGDTAAVEAALDETVAAVVVEAIQGEAGVVPAPEGFLAAVRAAATRVGALLWIDEVQTGIGRTGRWLAHQSAGILPDVVTLAKGLAGGIPIGACVAVGDQADALGPGSHGSTFGGNPVATAAALAVLDTIEREHLLDNAVAIGDRLARGVEGLGHPAVAGVRGEGLLRAIVLTRDTAKAVAAAALDAGFIVNAPRPDVIRLAPPLILTAAQADAFLGALPALLEAS